MSFSCLCLLVYRQSLLFFAPLFLVLSPPVKVGWNQLKTGRLGVREQLVVSIWFPCSIGIFKKSSTGKKHAHEEREQTCKPLLLAEKTSPMEAGSGTGVGYPRQWLLWCLALKNSGISSGFAEKTKCYISLHLLMQIGLYIKT